VKPFLVTLLLLAAAAPARADNPWSRVGTAHPGPPEVIGGYAAGCLAGARRLPIAGEGYQVMRPSRGRYYGHPRLIAFVERIGREASARGWGSILVGDLAQPRGGPMSSGHRSHQSGLDVDIWLRILSPGERPLSEEAVEETPMVSVVRAERGEVVSERWSPRLADLVRLAAEQPEVDRIFVHPVIKRALCDGTPGHDWLEKVRPWWGHDSHFHVRLACPPDSPRCRPQDPVPAGDGCDDALDQWIEELRLAAGKPAPPPPPAARPRLPAECSAVLSARPAASAARAVLAQ
jgi:penicillin-insensitive murein endopeptidase